MKLSSTAHRLYERMLELKVIDAHQHLPSESDYLAHDYSGLNMFAGGYIWHDLESAGLSPEFKATMREGGFRPVETWWPTIAPYWEQVKHTSYARALRVTARDLWGISDISEETIADFAAAVTDDNTPGLYRRVLQDRCGIELSITCVDQPAFPDDPGLVGITDLMKFAGPGNPVSVLSARAGRELSTLEEAVAAARDLLRRDLEAGAVGFKMRVGQHETPNLVAAEAEFKKACSRRGDDTKYPALLDYLFDACLDVAAEADVPVAVHTGYWGDFRELDPTLMFSFAIRRRDVRFDMFHLGMPMVREAALMGKNLPNVTVNLTWCPVISQLVTQRTLDEMIDLVPLNKVIAFGGDYRVAVQKTYGHLVLAREVVASALAARIDAGDFDADYALYVARLWFHDNPRQVYRLQEETGGDLPK